MSTIIMLMAAGIVIIDIALVIKVLALFHKPSRAQIMKTGRAYGLLAIFILSTLSVIREIWFEYLTSTQDSVNGSNAAATATVKIKFGGSNPWNTGPLGADGFIYMKLGEKQVWQNNDATGWTVTNATGDKVDFVHAVNDYDAKFRITIIGEK